MADVTAIPSPLDALRFDDAFVRALPGDPNPANHRRQVRQSYSRVMPTPVASPRILAWSTEVAQELGLPTAPDPDGPLAKIFGGNAIAEGMQPYAACYGGHQFGNWAGQLGDGRAITLGEVVLPDGARRELQLKGLALRRTHARAMDARCCACRCASFFAARRCITSVSRPRARCRWWAAASR